MPKRWSCLDHYNAVGHCIQSLEQIPFSFFTHNLGIIILHHIHPHFNGTSPSHLQQQPHNNLLSRQFAYYSHCYWSKSLANTHFICHQHSWHCRITNTSPHNERFCPKLVHQRLGSRHAWKWIHVASDLVSFWLVNWTVIHQPNHLTMILKFKFIQIRIERSAHNKTAITWSKCSPVILYLHLNLQYFFFCLVFIFCTQFQLFQNQLGWSAHTLALFKLTTRLGVSLARKHFDKYICVEYHQVNSVDQSFQYYKYHSLRNHSPVPPLFQPLQNPPTPKYND